MPNGSAGVPPALFLCLLLLVPGTARAEPVLKNVLDFLWCGPNTAIYSVEQTGAQIQAAQRFVYRLLTLDQAALASTSGLLPSTAISSSTLVEHFKPGVVEACDSASQTYLAARGDSYVVHRFSGETMASFEASAEQVPLSGMNGARGRYYVAIEATEPTPRPAGIMLDQPSGPHVQRIQLDRLPRVLRSALLADGRALFFSRQPMPAGKITAFVTRPDGSVGEVESNVLESTDGRAISTTIESVVRIVGNQFVITGLVDGTQSVIYCKLADTLECRLSKEARLVLARLVPHQEACFDRTTTTGIGAACSFVDHGKDCISSLDISAGMDRVRECVHPLPVVTPPAPGQRKAWYTTRDNTHAPVIALIHKLGDWSDLRARVSLAWPIHDVYLIAGR